MFHQFGLLHASKACGGGVEGQKGELWPPDERGHLNGIALNPTVAPYSFIANGLHEGEAAEAGWAKPLEKEPSFAFDFMSYCAPIGRGDPNDWVSPRNWETFVSTFGVSGAGASARVSARAAGVPSRAASAGAGGPLAATAQINPGRIRVIAFSTDKGIRIRSVGPQVGPLRERGTVDANYTLTALGPHGQALESVPMAATEGGHVDGAGPLMELTGYLPSSGVSSVEVLVHGTVTATRKRPARAPRVTVLSPSRGSRVGGRGNVLVRWRDTNPEHLKLRVAIDYSRDNGRTWRTIFAGRDRGSFPLPSFAFTASQNARVRVRVNDGFNAVAAVSGRFTALGAPPQVTITSRFAPGMTVAADAGLQFTGRALDQTAHTLSGRSLRWYDGSILLGYGSPLNAGPLPAGVNHIRCTATG